MWTTYTSTIPALRRRQSLTRDLGTEEAATAKAERGDVRWTAYKLWADLIFVCECRFLLFTALPTVSVWQGVDAIAYEVFDLAWFKEPVQCAAGLVAAGISTSKLYDQHWSASLAKG